MGRSFAQRVLERSSAEPRPEASVADADRVARIRAGDRAAFTDLFNTHYSALRAFAITLIHSATEAEELVQDVFFRIWKNRETWVLKGSLRSYLFIAVRNATSAHRRHLRIVERVEARVVLTGETPGMSAGSSPADRQAESDEIAQAFARALGALPERCRQVAILRWQHGLSHAEVAEVMGVTIKAVERQITQAAKTLRAELAAHSRW